MVYKYLCREEISDNGRFFNLADKKCNEIQWLEADAEARKT